jgi:hypothetical protein
MVFLAGVKNFSQKQDTEGTLTADGTEQTIREILTYAPGLVVYIDMTNMAANDTTVIRSYAKIKSGGAYIKQGSRTLSGAQDPPLMYIRDFPVPRYGFKVTLAQTAGTYRNYDWMTFLGV